MRTRILVVDDDADSRVALSALLESWGHDVETAETGQRAVAMAVARCPDVVILDLRLPDTTGETVCATMKGFPQAPFVVVYSGSDVDEAGARSAGCDAFVLKPALDELRDAVAGASRPRA